MLVSTIPPVTGAVKSNCTCCRPSGQTLVTVPLACPDGHSSTRSVPVPSSCTCSACGQETSAALTLQDDQAELVVPTAQSEQDAELSAFDSMVGDIFGDSLAPQAAAPQALVAKPVANIREEDIFGDIL